MLALITNLLLIASLISAVMANIVHIDSGASKHMVGDIASLTDVTRLSSPLKINTGNSSIYVEYSGTAYFKPFNGVNMPIRLEGVLFNPYCKYNLISQGLLMKKCIVNQSTNDAMVVSLKETGEHLFTAHQNSNNVFKYIVCLQQEISCWRNIESKFG